MIRKSKKIQESGGPDVPAYIVTFSDMITLLLTFFVMLLSLAQMQDPDLFRRSRDAFIEHIDCYGLGLLNGKQIVPELGEVKMKFFIPDSDDKTLRRTIDARQETLRDLFRKATESLDPLRSRVGVHLSDYTATGIHFSRGQTALDEPAKKYLTQFASNYRQGMGLERMELYVLGLAGDIPTEKEQWIISSLRAERVAEFLQNADLQCPIYSWGAGSGGRWTEDGSPISEPSQIFIAILPENGS